MEVDHKDKDGKGKAWFDQVQLEKGEVSSSYNPIQNSSFTAKTDGWSTSGTAADLDEGFDDDSSIKASRTNASQANAAAKQTVTLSQSADNKSSIYYADRDVQG
ncbi:hypothetical protein ACSE3M_09670 [Bacillus velezensis]